MSNVAKKIIIPSTKMLRIIFLYVGQGDATLVVIPDGDEYKYMLVDSHLDETCGGIDLIKMMEDLFDGEKDVGIDIYCNTHPHKDHLGKVKEIYENKKIGIKEVWHSGHKPGKDHEDAYKDLKYVMDKIGDENVYVLKGSNDEDKLNDKKYKLGDIHYNILAPAEYVADDIEDEKPKDRYNRIHEQCGVIRLKYGKEEKQILITGDADYDAWSKHITEYHKERLPSFVLSAAHHGSNSFFWKGDPKDEDPYKAHLDQIDPSHVVVSAPKRKESPHGHPDKEAMELYKEKVGEDKLHHLGDKRECVIVDIKEDGDIEVYFDDELGEEYGFGKKKNENGNEDKRIYTGVVTKVDKKPMG